MKNLRNVFLLVIEGVFLITSCNTPKYQEAKFNSAIPEYFSETSSDSLSTAKEEWSTVFQNDELRILIDSALQRNYEFNILKQELKVSENEIQAKKGAYLPFVSLFMAGESKKVGRYTSQGANDANTDIMDGKEFPEPLSNLMIKPVFRWELDVFKKLRNAKKAAGLRYLAMAESVNFFKTQLVAEVAGTYYELVSLRAQLKVLNQNINIQNKALKVVELQKQFAQSNLLAIKRFKAEIAKNKSEIFTIKQAIIEAENHLSFLTGQYQLKEIGISTDLSADFAIRSGVPSDLLKFRPDLRRAEYNLLAAHLDLKSARAEFFPSFTINAQAGLEAFNLAYLANIPSSLLYGVGGDMVMPLINRKEIKVNYSNANAFQIQRLYEYEKVILEAYIETANTLNRIENSSKAIEIKEEQVKSLEESIDVANALFKSARADYMEVLLTQRDYLDAKIEWIELRKELIISNIFMYKAIGGGWK